MAESQDAVRAPVMVSLKLLDGHPKNPRIRHDQDFISSLAAGMKDGFEPIYAPTVRRKADDRFEIIIGHRRKLAADKAGLDEIPVHIVDWSDERVLKELAFSNIQERLSTLEIALYSFEVEPAKGKKGAGIKEYAARWNLADSTLGRYRNGASVFQSIRSETSENVLGGLHDRVEHLAKIANAPKDKWQQLVERLVAEDWSIKEAERFVKEANASPITETQAGSVAEVVPLFPDGPPVNDTTGGDDVEDEDDDDDEEPASDDDGFDDAAHEHGIDEEQEGERTVETKSVEKQCLTGNEPQQRNPEDAIIHMVSDFLDRFAAIREMFVFPADMWADLFRLVDADVTVQRFLKALQLCVERHDLRGQLDVCPDKRGREGRRLKGEIQAVEDEFKALLAEQVK